MQAFARKPLRHLGAQSRELTEINAGCDAHAGHQISQVFGGHIATGPGCMRAAANAGQARVKTGLARLQCGHDIGQPQAARVVEMTATQRVTRHTAGFGKQLAHLAWVGIAHGVGQAHAVHTQPQNSLEQAQNFVDLDTALNRAAERGAHSDFDADGGTPCPACRHDGPDLGHHVIRRFAQIGQAVRVAGRQRQQHPVGAAVHGTLGPLQVGHQHRHDQARQGFGKGHQLGGVGQLGQQFGRHKRADFDLADARVVSALNPLQFLCGGQGAGNALQAVAQAHFADRHAFGPRKYSHVQCPLRGLRRV
jgi:hypothetical protein